MPFRVDVGTLMRCRWCKREITKLEARKMVTAHKQPDGSVALNIPIERKIASGPLLWAAHYKEYKEHDKREKRGGDSVSGSSLGANTPTAYDISGDMDTAAISARVQLKRDIATELGLDSENWRVAEVMRVRDHGGPYLHTHERPVESWKLAFHLVHAHGVTAGAAGVPDAVAHANAHIKMAKNGEEKPETDWRESLDIDV